MSTPPTSSRPFPIPSLVLLSILSCFIATAALVSSFTQVGTHYGYFVVPSTIGFIATIPYHLFMYKSAKAHRHSDEIMTNDWIIYNFLLITLWVVIFVINILFCVGEGTAGVIVTTILSGLEWIALLLLSILTIVEICQEETGDPVSAETQPLLNIHTAQPKMFSKYRKNLIYFISYTLCTLSLALAVDRYCNIVILFNVIAFFLTAPHHIALYITAMRPGTSDGLFPFLSRPTPVVYSFFLSAIWCGIVILDVVLPEFVYQVVLLSIFSGLECIIIAASAVRGVLDDFSGGQIKL